MSLFNFNPFSSSTLRDELLCNIHFTDVETEANKVMATQDFTANEGRIKMIPGNSSMKIFLYCLCKC